MRLFLAEYKDEKVVTNNLDMAREWLYSTILRFQSPPNPWEDWEWRLSTHNVWGFGVPVNGNFIPEGTISQIPYLQGR